MIEEGKDDPNEVKRWRLGSADIKVEGSYCPSEGTYALRFYALVSDELIMQHSFTIIGSGIVLKSTHKIQLPITLEIIP
jgi:ribosomal protein L30E